MSRGRVQAQRVAGSFGGKIRRLVFSDANFLDDAQARPARARLRLRLPLFCFPDARPTLAPFSVRQLEEDNREVLRLLRDSGVPEKLEGLKRLIAQSAPPKRLACQTRVHAPALTRRAPLRAAVSVGRDVSNFFPTVVRAGRAPFGLSAD